MGGFLARVTPADKADHGDQHKAGLNEKLAAVEPVDRVTLQRGIREKAMEEESRRCEIDAEMEGLPQMPS